MNVDGAAVLSGSGTLTVRGLIPFTSDMMSRITIELNDREIYNDIRSTVDVTEYHEDETAAEYDTGEVKSEQLLVYGSRETTGEIEVTLTAPRKVTQWYSAYPYNINGSTVDGFYNETQCINAGGGWREDFQQCWGVSASYAVTIYVRNRTETSITLWITNSLNAPTHFNVAVPYQYAVSDAYVTPRTEFYTLKVRATDSDSIAKYGRRVMNLTWPLGQTEEQMQELVDNYLLRYKEPVVQMRVTLLGINDAMANRILHTHISDKVWIEDTTIGVSDYFYVNAMSVEHHVSGLLEATWDTERMRDYEKEEYWVWDESIWDGSAVWAP